MLEPTTDIFQPVERNEPKPVTPNNPPWGSGIAIGVWILSVLLIAIVPVFFIIPYWLSRKDEFANFAEFIPILAKDPTAIVLQLFAIIPAHLLTLAAAWLVVTRGRTYPFASTLGWRTGGMQWWHYIAIMLGFFALASAVGYFLPEQENEMLRILKSSRYAVFMVAAMAVLTAPIVEEVVYRGLLYSALQRTVGVGLAVAIVTFLFAIVHLPQYYPSVSTMILLTLLSLVLTLIRVKTDNLLPCIILHTVFNGFQAVLLIIEPYVKLDSTIEDAAAAILLLK